MPMFRILLAAAVVAPLTVSLQAQSLADAARKAEEQRVKAEQEQAKTADTKDSDKPAATKVYTNKDLQNVPATAVVPAPPETVAKEPVVGGTDLKTRVEGTTTVKDEDWWRSRALALRRTLADNQTKLVAAQVYYDGLPDRARGVLGAPVVEAWMKAKEEISRLSAVVVNDKRALADFEEEARRAGVPPGWLRER